MKGRHMTLDEEYEKLKSEFKETARLSETFFKIGVVGIARNLNKSCSDILSKLVDLENEPGNPAEDAETV